MDFTLFIPRDVIDFSTNYSKQMQQKVPNIGSQYFKFLTRFKLYRI